MKTYLYCCILLFLIVSCVSCGSKAKQEVINKVNKASIPQIIGPTTISRKIKQRKEGNLLIASYEGIIEYDGKSFVNFTKIRDLDTCAAFDVLEDKKEHLWIASNSLGVFYYNGKTFKNFTTKDGLPNNRVMDLHEDTKGNIWIGTEGGLSKYDGKAFTNFTTKEGLPDNSVNCIREDTKGNIWIGTRGEACYFDGNKFILLENEEGQPFKNIWSIIEDQKGNVWLGGAEGLWSYAENVFTKYSSNKISCIFEDSKGVIWITNSSTLSNKYALCRFDSTSFLSGNSIGTPIYESTLMFFGIGEDKEGHIWVGTLDGVFRYDGMFVHHFEAEKAK